MAASVYTQPTPNNPYVLPVDLGLLAKVNQYKQSVFYQNAEKETQGLNQLNNLDIINDAQRGYLKDKVNNLTTSINDMGGLDYSDMNVSNSLAGYTADVYNDNTIINAVGSTKNLRSYINNTQALKTDPKLAKFYDPSREWWDMQSDLNPNNANNYIKGGLGAKYNGPTAPAPYLGNDFDLLSANVTKLAPDIVEGHDGTANRFFIDKTTNTRVSPERIMALVDGRIDGALADQLKVHAAYNYFGLTNGTYSKDQGAAEYSSGISQQIAATNARIKTLQSDIIDPVNTTRAANEQELKDLQGTYLPALQKQLSNANNTFGNQWDKDKLSAVYGLYRNKLNSDIVNAYSYSQTKHQLIVDQQAVFNGRVQLEAAKLGKKVQYNADGTFDFVDGANSGDPQPGALSNVEVNKDAKDKLDSEAVSQASLTTENSNIQKDLSNSLIDLIHTTADHAQIKGLLDYSQPAIGNDPNANPILHPDLVKKIAMLTGDENLSPSDIDALLAMNKTGNDQYSLTNWRQPQDKIYLTPTQVEFFQKVKDVMDQGAAGKDITNLIPDSGKWKQYLNNYSISHNAIAYNKSLIDIANNTILAQSDVNLTTKEQGLIKEYMANPAKYYKYNSTTSSAGTSSFGVSISTGDNRQEFTGPKEMQDALVKIGGVGNISGKVDALLNNTATRKNYYNILLPDTKKELNEQHNTIINSMWSEISKNENPDQQLGITKKEDISPTSIVTDGKDYYISYSDASGKIPGTGYAKIEPQNLSGLKVPVIPYPQLEKVVSQNGRLMEPIYIDPLMTKNQFNIDNNFSGPIKVQVTRMGGSGGSLNGNRFEASIVGPDNKEYFYQFSNSATANAALQKVTQLIQDNKSYKNLSELLLTLQESNNQ